MHTSISQELLGCLLSRAPRGWGRNPAGGATHPEGSKDSARKKRFQFVTKSPTPRKTIRHGSRFGKTISRADLAGCAAAGWLVPACSHTPAAHAGDTSSLAAGLPFVAAPRLSQLLSSQPLLLQLHRWSCLAQEWSMQWIALPQPGQAPATPQRPSQIVHESTAPGETGQHAVITMERVSTGGTRYAQQFRRQ